MRPPEKYPTYLFQIAMVAATIGTLALARVDFGATGAVLVVSFIAGAIFIELIFIRTALINIYADALTEHKVMLFLIKKPVINMIVSAVISLYLSLYLFTNINTNPISHLVFYLFAGMMLSILSGAVDSRARSVTKERASQVVSRVVVIFIVVFTTVLIDAAYKTFSPTDIRINDALDANISTLVSDDIKHSYTHLQHLLRTIHFANLNMQSIALIEDNKAWFDAVRFLLSISPTPYIAYALLFLSFSSIAKRFWKPEPPQ